MSLEKIIDIAILWGPTIFLVLSLVLGIIWGLIRGFRKSVILFIQAIVACIICTVAYSIVVNMDSIDRNMVSIVNNFMGSEYALQEELEVSQSCLTMRDILVEFIPKNLDYGDGIALIVKENGQYLATLVDMAYHLIWALVFVVIYFILVFVFYIIYLIFYPEGRYRRRKNRKYRQLQSEKPYRKHPLLGALVGGGRSVITSLIVLSFVGSLFFILAGGEGNREKDDYEFGDKDVDLVYSIYQSIGSYGTEGIFKILNTVKDSDDVPYYLYAADLVFQGDLKDPNRGINENVHFRNELAAYVGFTEDTLDLLLKYGGDQIRDIVLDRTDEEVLDILVEIMAKPEFQEDFGKIIDEFDGQTYFINFSLSLVDSIVNHLDETGFADDLGSDTIELINILFKKGYLSDSIPSEKELKEELANNPNAKPEDYTLAYINPTALLTKEDTKELVKLVLAILQIDDEQDEVELISDYAGSVVPAIQKLSILSDKRKNEINPVLSRLYQYLEATLIEDSNEEVTLSYTKTTLSNGDETLDLSSVDWIKEINMLLDIAFDVTTIIDTAYDKDADYYELFFDIFKEGNEAAAQSYDNIVDCLANSELLGLVLSSKYVDDALVDAIPNIYVSDSITYLNKYDEHGNVTEYGELYNLLTAIRVIGTNQENRDIVSKLMDFDSLSDAELLETISDAVRSITSGDDNALDYVLDSKLVLSIASAYIIDSKDIAEGFEMYIPDSVLERDENGQAINIIKRNELEPVLYNAANVLDVVIPYLDKDNPETYNKITPLVNSLTEGGDNSIINKILDSTIIQGTIVIVIADTLTDESVKDYITMPDGYMNNGSANVEQWIEEQELSKLVNAISVSGLDIDAFMVEDEDEQQDAILEQIKLLGEKENSADEGQRPVLQLLKSKVLHYTLSGLLITENDEKPLIDGVTIIVPEDSKENRNLIKADEISGVVKVLPDLLDAIEPILEDSENIDIDVLVSNLASKKPGSDTSVADRLLESNIIHYTLASTLSEQLSKEDLSDFVAIPKDLVNPDGSANLDAWVENAEISSFINAVVESNISFNALVGDYETSSEQTDAILNELTKEEADLGSLLDSRILHYTVSSLLITEDGEESLIEGITIVVPSHENDNGYINKTTLIHLVENITVLLPDSNISTDSEEYTNTLVLNAINNRNNLLENTILSATIVTILNDGETLPEDVRELITIPTNLEEASKDIDTIGTSKNPWTNELPAVLDALDELLCITGNDDFTFDNPNLADDVLANISTLNEVSAIGEGTKLDVCYKSTIIQYTLTNQIISNEDITNEITIPSDVIKNEVLDKDEIKALISAVNELEIDLTNPSIEALPLETINEEIISSSVIIRATLYKQLNDETSDLVIPNSALDGDDRIATEEINILFAILKNNASLLFGEADSNGKYNINNVSLNELSVNNIKNLNTGSIILEATIINQLVVNEGLSGTISMPLSYSEAATKNELVETYGLITNGHYVNIWNYENEGNNELDNLINALGHLVGYDVDLMDSANMSEESLMNNVLTLNDDQTKLDETYASIIIKSTLTDNINELDDINVPNAAYDDQYISKKEIYDLITAIEELDLDINNPNLTSLPLADIDAEMVAPSYIIRATLYAQFNTNAGDKLIIPTAVVKDDEDNDYITTDETIYLLEALQMNANSFFGAPTVNGEKEYYDITNVSISSISINMIKSIKEDSIIMQATIINQLSTNTTINTQITMPNEYSVDATSANLIAKYGDTNIWNTVTEGNNELDNLIQALEYILGEENSDSDLLAGDVLTEDVIVNNVLNLNVLINDSTSDTKLHVSYYSEVFKATITNKLASMTDSGIYVPKAAYDGDYIEESEMSNLITSANKLGIDLTSEIGYLALDYSDNEASDISKSIIIRAILYAQFDTLEEMVIPNAAAIIANDTDDYSYLNRIETTVLLQRLKENKDTLFVSNSEGLYDVTSVNITEGLSINLINNLKKDSLILQATIISNIITQGTISLPNKYSTDNLKANYGTKDSIWFDTSELDNMMLGLSHLVDPNANITEIDTATLQNNIIDLNNEGVNGTKLDDCYASVVISMNLTVELDNVLYGKVDDAVIDSVKDNGIYNKEEIAALIDSMNILGLTNEIDTQAVTNKVLDLNNDDLTIIYKSTIVKYILSAEVKTALTGNINAEYVEYDGIQELIVKDETNSYYNYIQSEILGLINALNEILADGQTLDDINSDVISNAIFNANVNNLYGSFMIRNELSAQLASSLESQNISTEINTASMEKDINEKYIYKAVEVQSLINALKAIGVNGSDSLEGTINVELNTIKDNLDTIYESNIVVDILTAKIDEMLEDKAYEIDYRPYAKEQFNNTNVWLFKKEEIANLINVLANYDLDVLDVASLTIEEVSNMVNGSVVIQAVASKTIVDNDQLIVPTSVKDTTNTIENSFMIRIDHINALLDFLNVHVSDGLNTLNITEFNPTLSDSDAELIGASVILNATIANEIYANEFVYAPISVKQMTDNVERSVVDNVVVNKTTDIISIESSEVTAFIDALVTGLSVSNIRSIDNGVLDNIGELTAEKKAIITSSKILNATITNNLSISEEGLIIYALTDTSYEVNAENENTYVYMLANDELISLIEAIGVFGSNASESTFEVDLSLDNLTNIAGSNITGFENALDSNVIRLVVTQVLINEIGTTALGVMGITIESISAYNIQIIDIEPIPTNVSSISKEQISGYF